MRRKSYDGYEGIVESWHESGPRCLLFKPSQSCGKSHQHATMEVAAYPTMALSYAQLRHSTQFMPDTKVAQNINHMRYSLHALSASTCCNKLFQARNANGNLAHGPGTTQESFPRGPQRNGWKDWVTITSLTHLQSRDSAMQEVFN